MWQTGSQRHITRFIDFAGRALRAELEKYFVNAKLIVSRLHYREYSTNFQWKITYETDDLVLLYDTTVASFPFSGTPSGSREGEELA